MAIYLQMPAVPKDEKQKERGKKILIAGLICIGLFLLTMLSKSSSGGNKCEICGKVATNTFQGSQYCNEHYQSAIIWSFDNVKTN